MDSNKDSLNSPGNLLITSDSLLDSHPNPFIIIDENYTIIAANKAYCDAYKRPRDHVVGSKCHKISHNNDAPCSNNGEDCPLEQVLKDGQHHEYLHVHKDQFKHDEETRIRGYLITDSNGNRYLGEEIIQISEGGDPWHQDQALVGHSSSFLGFLEAAVCAADTDDNLLVTGECGAGKDQAARLVHARSERRYHPFVTFSCATANDNFIGSELFGHEDRALPGCSGRRNGLIHEAEGGTLYLDEIGDLSPDLQARLLHFIETGQYNRVGGKETLDSDVRIIASSNRALDTMIQHKTFRADLYYRLSVITLHVPSLRERRSDIPFLSEHILARIKKKTGKQYSIDDKAMEALTGYNYKGNIKELENILLRAANRCHDSCINEEHLKNCLTVNAGNDNHTNDIPMQYNGSISDMESTHIRHLLETHKGHRRKVAEVLKISERTLYRKLVKHKLTTVGKDNGTR